MTKPVVTVTQAYRCDDYSTVGWAVEFDGEYFGVGSTWGEALCNAIYEKDEQGDIGEYKVVVPNKIRARIREEAAEHGVEDNFEI